MDSPTFGQESGGRWLEQQLQPELHGSGTVALASYRAKRPGLDVGIRPAEYRRIAQVKGFSPELETESFAQLRKS